VVRTYVSRELVVSSVSSVTGCLIQRQIHLHLRLQTHRPLPYPGVASDNCLESLLKKQKAYVDGRGPSYPH
jgi:hypothetical protein